MKRPRGRLPHPYGDADHPLCPDVGRLGRSPPAPTTGEELSAQLLDILTSNIYGALEDFGAGLLG